jgi:hypothetical protein
MRFAAARRHERAHATVITPPWGRRRDGAQYQLHPNWLTVRPVALLMIGVAVVLGPSDDGSSHYPTCDPMSARHARIPNCTS